MSSDIEKSNAVESPGLRGTETDLKRISEISRAVGDAVVKNRRRGKELTEQLRSLEEDFLSKYPNSQEETLLILHTPRYVENRVGKLEKLERGGRVDEREVQKVKQDFAEQNFLLTNFILANQADRGYLLELWRRLRGIAQLYYTQQYFETIHRGILAQVATMKILQNLNLEPRLVSPKEDVSLGGDIWIKTKNRTALVTVKGSELGNRAYVRTMRGVGFTTPDVADPEHKKRLSRNKQAFGRLRKKLATHAADRSIQIEPIAISIPESEIDSVTGEPNQQLRDELTPLLKSLLREEPNTN